MKRFLASLLAAALAALLLPFAAHADVLYVPDNPFYVSHQSDCNAMNRSFQANGANGYVSLQSKPGTGSRLAKINNGETFGVSYTYDDNGDIWGLTEVNISTGNTGNWVTGWAELSQLLLVYDYISFADEHQSEFYSYTGSYDSLKNANENVLWSWPGSGAVITTLDPTFFIDNGATFEYAYKDTQDREWGYVSIYGGKLNGWICVSDPANTSIPAFDPAPPPAPWQAESASNSSQSIVNPQSGDLTPWIIIILVAVLVAGTAVLISVFWRPEKKAE